MTRLDEIKERLAKAKGPGPWESLVRVHAPADIAWLVGEVESLTKERDEFLAIVQAVENQWANGVPVYGAKLRERAQKALKGGE